MKTIMKAPAGWTAEKARLTRRLVLKDFAEAVRLIGEIAKLADAMDHHPDLHLTGYRNLALELTTHSAGGVTDKDYELAAKIEALPRSEKKA